MKVAHVISGIDPRHGGPSRVVAGFLPALRQAGVDAHLLATWRTGDEMTIGEQLERNGVPVTLVGPCRGRLRRHPDLRNQVKTLVSTADVVHIHALWEEVQYLAATIAEKSGVPYLIRPCGMLSPWSLTQSKLRKHLYYYWRLRRMLVNAAGVHFASEEERRLAKLPSVKVKAVVQPNGLDLTEFSDLPPRGMFRARCPEINGRRIVLFQGRIHPVKGLDILIRAFALLAMREVVLVIAGPGEESYQAELQFLARALGLDQCVIFAGMQRDRERLEALVDADLFVLPSRHESFGIAAVEAVAAGVPAVVSDQVNIWIHVKEAGVGEICRVHEDSLARVLEVALTSNELSARAMVYGPEWAKRMYSWKAIAGDWNVDYQKVLGVRQSSSDSQS